jgi:hypothetical protein
MRRVLKETGSIYVHCDWHASHYIKTELDKKKYQPFYDMIAKKIVLSISEAVKKQPLVNLYHAPEEYVDKLVLKGVLNHVDWYIEVAYDSMAKGKDPFSKTR